MSPTSSALHTLRWSTHRTRVPNRFNVDLFFRSWAERCRSALAGFLPDSKAFAVFASPHRFVRLQMAQPFSGRPWTAEDGVEDDELPAVPVLFGEAPAAQGSPALQARSSRSREGRSSKRRSSSRQPSSPSGVLRNKIESLLRAEARLADRLTSSNRRMLARKQPEEFMAVIIDEMSQIERCMVEASKDYVLNRSAILLQHSKRHGPRCSWSDAQAQAFERACANVRRISRERLVQLDHLRDEKRTQAMEIFERVAPTFSTREKWLRKRLITVRNEAKNSTDGKQHMATAARQYQEEAVNIVAMMRKLEGAVMQILGISKRRIAEMQFSAREEPWVTICAIECTGRDVGKTINSPARGLKHDNAPDRFRPEGRRFTSSVRLDAPPALPVFQVGATALDEARLSHGDLLLLQEDALALRRVRGRLASMQERARTATADGSRDAAAGTFAALELLDAAPELLPKGAIASPPAARSPGASSDGSGTSSGRSSPGADGPGGLRSRRWRRGNTRRQQAAASGAASPAGDVEEAAAATAEERRRKLGPAALIWGWSPTFGWEALPHDNDSSAGRAQPAQLPPLTPASPPSLGPSPSTMGPLMDAPAGDDLLLPYFPSEVSSTAFSQLTDASQISQLTTMSEEVSAGWPSNVKDRQSWGLGILFLRTLLSSTLPLSRPRSRPRSLPLSLSHSRSLLFSLGCSPHFLLPLFPTCIFAM